MSKRILIKQVEPAAYQAMYELENYTKNSEIPFSLRELIKIRASQINKCSYCLDMHTKDALAAGESLARINSLPSWKESDLYSEKEKSALQLAEEVTMISVDGVSDETYNNALRSFGEKPLAQIIMLIVTINAWNRIAVATKLKFA